MIVKDNNKIIKHVPKALEHYKSIKIKLRLHLTSMKFDKDFDGHKEAEKREAHLANKQVPTIAQPNIETAMDEQKR